MRQSMVGTISDDSLWPRITLPEDFVECHKEPVILSISQDTRPSRNRTLHRYHLSKTWISPRSLNAPGLLVCHGTYSSVAIDLGHGDGDGPLRCSLPAKETRSRSEERHTSLLSPESESAWPGRSRGVRLDAEDVGAAAEKAKLTAFRFCAIRRSSNCQFTLYFQSWHQLRDLHFELKPNNRW